MHTRRTAIKVIATAALAGPQIFAQVTAPAEVFKLAPLPFDYDALEPHIDAETMKLHHDKHHATYVAKLNEAIAKAPELAGKPIEELLSNLEAAPEGVVAQ